MRPNNCIIASNQNHGLYLEGFPAKEVIGTLKLTADTIVQTLIEVPELGSMEQRIHHEFMVSLQMVIDIIEETYEIMTGKVETEIHIN